MQPYPPVQQPPPPAHQRPRVANAAMAIVLVVALGVIGVAIASPETVRSAFAPNPVSTLPGGGTTAPSTKKTTASPTSGPWIPQPSTTRTTRTTTTPSILPTPTGEQSLSGNPIYQAGGMTKQVCAPPGWPSDGPAGQAFYATSKTCLENAWRPLFERVRLEYDAPKVIVPTGASVSSPCGSMDGKDYAAFYCNANQAIYMPIQTLQEGAVPLIYLSVFAHEFGHHVQQLTGTLSESWERERAAGINTPAGLELSRRLELQAQCYSGLFVETAVDSGGPFTRADVGPVLDRYGNTGADTHGNAEHRQSWWTRGMQNQIGLCDTWSASSAEVS